MSRHVDNLERLFNRLRLCLGKDDELTQQVELDLERLKRVESVNPLPSGRSVSYRKFMADATRDSHSNVSALSAR